MFTRAARLVQQVPSEDRRFVAVRHAGVRVDAVGEHPDVVLEEREGARVGVKVEHVLGG